MPARCAILGPGPPSQIAGAGGAMQSNQQVQRAAPAAPPSGLHVSPPRRVPKVWVWLAACVAIALLGDAVLLIARQSPSTRPAADFIIDLLFGLPGAVSFLLVIA